MALALPTTNTMVQLPSNRNAVAPLLWPLFATTAGVPCSDSASTSKMLDAIPGPGLLSSNGSNINAIPPSGGLNVGGHGANGGNISANIPAAGNSISEVSVPAGDSVTVTGENGGVGSGEDQGNGGTITITNNDADADEAELVTT